jgi:hypothetical protein
MEKLTQIGTLNGGKVFVPTLTTGFSQAPDYEHVFFLQSRCRIVFQEMTAAVRLMVAYNNGMQYVEMTLYPDLNGNIYAPLNDVLSAYFDRPDNNILGLSGMDGLIEMFAIDADGNILDQDIINALMVCDCMALRSGYPGGGFDHLLPETFRLPSSPLYRPDSYIGCRLTHGVNLVELVSGGNTYSHFQRFSDGRAVGCNLSLKGIPSVVRVYEDTDTLLQEAHFDLVDCLDDKIFLKWWSCEDGIWKTRVADIVGEGVEINGTDNYMRDFADMQAKNATAFVAARFDSLTSRDYCYYRDLLTSDEVYIIAPADTAETTGDLSAIRVTIDGDIDTAKQNKRTTIEFNINYSNFSEL